MITELFQWLTTPCSPAARRFGYLREAIGIDARYRRHPDAWAPHLEASRQVILRAMAGCARRRCAVVLGSGLLLDVPLAELAGGFNRVELVDMVHLRGARRIAARHPNVSLREADVTGRLAGLSVDDGIPPSGDPPTLPEDADLVISANLLSQLPELPCAWLARRKDLPEAARGAIARDIIAAHVDWLATLPVVACLVSETERRYVARDSTVLRGWDALYGARLPPPDAVWSWDIAPVGEAARGFTQRNTVCGIADLAAARAGVRRAPV